MKFIYIISACFFLGFTVGLPQYSEVDAGNNPAFVNKYAERDSLNWKESGLHFQGVLEQPRIEAESHKTPDEDGNVLYSGKLGIENDSLAESGEKNNKNPFFPIKDLNVEREIFEMGDTSPKNVYSDAEREGSLFKTRDASVKGEYADTEIEVLETSDISHSDLGTEREVFESPFNSHSIPETGRGIVDVQKKGLRSVSYIIHPDNLPPPNFKPIKDLIPSKASSPDWEEEEEPEEEEEGGKDSTSGTEIPVTYTSRSADISNASRRIVSTSLESDTVAPSQIELFALSLLNSLNDSLEKQYNDSEETGNLLMIPVERKIEISDNHFQRMPFKDFAPPENSSDLSNVTVESNSNGVNDSEISEVGHNFLIHLTNLLINNSKFENGSEPFGNNSAMLFLDPFYDGRNESVMKGLIVENATHSNHTPRYEESNSGAYNSVKNFLSIATSQGLKSTFLSNFLKNFGSLDHNALKLIYSLVIQPLFDRRIVINEDSKEERYVDGKHEIQKSSPLSNPSSLIHPNFYRRDFWKPLSRFSKSPSLFKGSENIEVITAPSPKSFEVVLGSSLNHHPNEPDPRLRPPKKVAVAQNRMGGMPPPPSKLTLGLNMPPPEALAALPEGSVLIPPSQVIGKPVIPNLPPLPSTPPKPTSGSLAELFSKFSIFRQPDPDRTTSPKRKLPSLPSFLSSLFNRKDSESPEKRPRFDSLSDESDQHTFQRRQQLNSQPIQTSYAQYHQFTHPQPVQTVHSQPQQQVHPQRILTIYGQPQQQHHPQPVQTAYPQSHTSLYPQPQQPIHPPPPVFKHVQHQYPGDSAYQGYQYPAKEPRYQTFYSRHKPLTYSEVTGQTNDEPREEDASHTNDDSHNSFYPDMNNEGESYEDEYGDEYSDVGSYVSRDRVNDRHFVVESAGGHYAAQPFIIEEAAPPNQSGSQHFIAPEAPKPEIVAIHLQSGNSDQPVRLYRTNPDDNINIVTSFEPMKYETAPAPNINSPLYFEQQHQQQQQQQQPQQLEPVDTRTHVHYDENENSYYASDDQYEESETSYYSTADHTLADNSQSMDINKGDHVERKEYAVPLEVRNFAYLHNGYSYPFHGKGEINTYTNPTSLGGTYVLPGYPDTDISVLKESPTQVNNDEQYFYDRSSNYDYHDNGADEVDRLDNYPVDYDEEYYGDSHALASIDYSSFELNKTSNESNDSKDDEVMEDVIAEDNNIVEVTVRPFVSHEFLSEPEIILSPDIGPVDVPEGTVIPKEDFEEALSKQKYKNKFKRPPLRREWNENLGEGGEEEELFETPPSFPSLADEYDASIAHLWNNVKLVPYEDNEIQSNNEIKPVPSFEEEFPSLNFTDFEREVVEKDTKRNVMAYVLIGACVGLACLSIVAVFVIVRFRKTCGSKQIGGRSFLENRSALKELSHVQVEEEKAGHKLGSWFTGRNEQLGTGKLRSNMTLPDVREKLAKSSSTRDLLSISPASSQNSTPRQSQRSSTGTPEQKEVLGNSKACDAPSTSNHGSSGGVGASWLHEEFAPSKTKSEEDGRSVRPKKKESKLPSTSSSYQFYGGRPREYRGKKTHYLTSLESEELERATTRTSQYPTDSEMDDTHYEMSDSKEADEIRGLKRSRRKGLRSMDSQELGEELSRDLKVFQYGDKPSEDVRAPTARGYPRNGVSSFSRDNVQSEVFLEFDNILRQHTHRVGKSGGGGASVVTAETVSVSRANSPDSIDKDSVKEPPPPPRPPKPNRLSPTTKTPPKNARARAQTPPPREDSHSDSSTDEDRLI